MDTTKGFCDNDDSNDNSDCEKMDDINCITTEDSVYNDTNDCVETSENNDFGSHVLKSKCTDSDQSQLPSSFATIAEKYENTRSDVILPKGDLPSTLSLISKNYQDSSSDDDDDDSDDDNIEIDEKCFDSDEGSIVSTSKKYMHIKTKGELDISDLPPIEDLKISVDESKCEPVGCVKSIVDTLVIVEAFLNNPALDIDSVLFVDRGQRALGRIFDVFGPVTKPYYAIRFNNNEHIINFKVQIKEPVYCAPKTEYASFVLISQLMQMKGSDASWKNNNEPPQECLDYSDDEAEKMAKKKRKQKKRVKLENGDSNDKSPDREGIAKNTSTFSGNNTYSSVQRSNHWTSQQTHSPRPSSRPQSTNNGFGPTQQQIHRPQSTNNSFGPTQQQTYSPFSSDRPQSTNNGFSPRPFPTYAQHLRAMEYSHSYHQPYNPWYYNQDMYPPAQSNPQFQCPQYPPPDQSPQFNYPQRPQQFNYPQQPPHFNYPQQPNNQNDPGQYRY